jgi:hypothetical protein
MNTDINRVGWMISLASAGYGSSLVAQHLLGLHLVFQPNWKGGIFAFFNFFKQIPHQKEHEISMGIFSPT